MTAEVTMTLALPKIGLRDHPAVGRLLLADISVPRTISEPLGGAPEFSLAPILDLFLSPREFRERGIMPGCGNRGTAR